MIFSREYSRELQVSCISNLFDKFQSIPLQRRFEPRSNQFSFFLFLFCPRNLFFDLSPPLSPSPEICLILNLHLNVSRSIPRSRDSRQRRLYYIEETADWTDSKHCLTSSPRIPIAPDPHDTRTKSCDAGNRDFRVVSPARAGKERETQRRYIQHLSDEQMEGGGKKKKGASCLFQRRNLIHCWNAIASPIKIRDLLTNRRAPLNIDMNRDARKNVNHVYWRVSTSR